MKQTLVSYLVIASIFASASDAEFQVNTRPACDQTYANIAMDANDNFVVVWTSYFEDGNSNDIFGRLFDSGANPMGNEFRINTTRLGNQTEPSVAMDAAGNFVVVWQGPQAIGDANEDIFAQRFEPNGQPVGGEFHVNNNPNGKQLHPKVAMSKTGVFVIVWENNAYWPLFDYFEILFRLYDPNGTPIDANTANLLSHCYYPDVAMDGDGDFTIVWMQDDIYHTSNIILARRYKADGAAKADPCQVSTTDFFSIAHPSIAADGTGHFVVVWDGNPGPAAQDNILARRYKFDGTPLSGEFIVNTTLTGTQQNPKVAMNNQRRFIIVWDSEIDPNSNVRDIFGQRYDEWYRPIGDEFRANTYVVYDQKYPDVVLKENGEFVSVWQSYGQDGSGYGIFGQMGPLVGSADFTGDGFVNFRDYCILAQDWLKEGNPLRADLIDDNRIDGQDLAHFCEKWLTPCYECDEVDIYNDDKIDFKDYCLLAANWKKCGPNLNGDFTGNGTVDFADLKALALHWAKTCEQ
jgi:hypothetical protein